MNIQQSKKLKETVQQLSEIATLKILHCDQNHHEEKPSLRRLDEIVELCRTLIFPGYFGNTDVNQENLTYYVGINVERLQHLLAGQIRAGLCFSEEKDNCLKGLSQKAEKIANNFIAFLPQVREILTKDVIASYKGDPAAKSCAEVITCYPGIRAICNYRIAHFLEKQGVPIIPRIITEMAHSETGIDIHPAAEIGESFCIDHGTGVVIGETAILGNNVKLYQGVTLGAKNFPLDKEGNPIKDIPRHPVLGNNVIVYSNASILGRISIGDNTIIGGNLWVTEDIPAGSHVLQSKKQISEGENL